MASISSSTDSQIPNETEHFLEGVIPRSCCAHASSTVAESVHCDVFINHYGKDVKDTLANELFVALNNTGIKVFLDKDWLVPGDDIPAEILAAMSNASVHIAILSKNYALSPWCLAELKFMLTTRTKILPVFYHVQPCDLRWTNKENWIYAKAFEDLEGRKDHRGENRYPPDKLEDWKRVLEQVSLIDGSIINETDDGKQEALNSIMNSVLALVEKEPEAKDLVGLDDAVRDFEKVANESVRREQSVKVLGIVGMGGSGKTTLAQELYRRQRSSFINSTFLFDVKDDGEKKALPGLQKKLLDGLLPRRFDNKEFKDVHEGKRVLKNRLRLVPVLIVLDDVDDTDQLDALFPEGLELRAPSLVIVTTRDKDVLTSPSISYIYEMKMLTSPYARNLFCRHAFSRSDSPLDFKQLVDKFIEDSGGLPLSLKVLGSQLRGKPTDYWESQFSKISTLPPKKITERLKISYDALQKEEKEMFLDLACFFIKENKSLVTAVWDGENWSGLQIFERLRNKCLVEIDGQNHIRMHNHLRDLGKQIASEHSPYRLFSEEHFDKILNYHYGTTPSPEPRLSIRGIMAATTQFVACSARDEFPRCSSDYQPPFKQCIDLLDASNKLGPNLRLSLGLNLLVIKGDCFKKEFAQLSRDVVWLRWFDFNHTNIPSWLAFPQLKVLELHGALRLDKLWEDEAPQAPLQLRELVITSTLGSSFHSFPSSISQLKHLRKIALIGYLGEEFLMNSLPEEFCDLISLEHLELRHCRALWSLPIAFGMLTRLQHLDLCSCKEIRMLPASFNQLKQLVYLDVSHCHKLKLRSNMLQNITTLENLYFSGCWKLQELPENIINQVALKQFHVQDTRLRNLPDALFNLNKLEILKIGSPLLTSLPNSLENLSRLTRLEIADCLEIEVLPDSFGRLVHLKNLSLELLGVQSLPRSFGKLAKLQTLHISGCPISYFCFGSESTCLLPELKVINLRETSVTVISISQGCCPSLKTVQLRQNDYLREIEALPSTVKIIELSDCKELNNIRGAYVLQNLQVVEISGCPKLPENIPEVPSIIRRE